MFMSAMKVRKWLANGCACFLASIVDTSKKEKAKLEDVSVVNEFVDVYPKNLLGLPPNQEVTFKLNYYWEWHQSPRHRIA